MGDVITSILAAGFAQQRDRINDVFDLLGLLVVRLTLLALEIIGAYTLIWGGHHHG